MSVSLDPATQLSFRKPFTQLVKETLAVSNHNAQPVAFKIKTTAPKLYCVRPNSGRIEPGETVEVQVLLQPMKEDPPLSVKCKDKFLVQSTYITPEKESLSLNDIWNPAAGDDTAKIHQQKLKVAYLPAHGALPEEDEPEYGHSSLLTHGSDSRFDALGHYDTARPHTNGHSDNPAIPIFDASATQPGRTSITPPRAHTPEHQDFAPADDFEPVAAPILDRHSPSKGPSPDLAAQHVRQLNEARTEIARLQGLLAAQEHRRRSKRVDDGSVAADNATDDGASLVDVGSQPEGVPLNVVAILSFVVFIVTYLFF